MTLRQLLEYAIKSLAPILVGAGLISFAAPAPALSVHAGLNFDGTWNTLYRAGEKPQGGDTCLAGYTCGNLGTVTSGQYAATDADTIRFTCLSAGDETGVCGMRKSGGSESNRHLEAKVVSITGAAEPYGAAALFIGDSTTWSNYKSYCWWPTVTRTRFKTDAGGAGEASALGLTGQTLDQYIGLEYSAALDTLSCWESQNGTDWTQVGTGVVRAFGAHIYGAFGASDDDSTTAAITTMDIIADNTTLSFTDEPPPDPPAAQLCEENFDSVNWATDESGCPWGQPNSATGNPTQGNSSGNVFRRTSASQGVTPIDGPMLECIVRTDSNYGCSFAVHIVTELDHITAPGEELYFSYYLAVGTNWKPKSGWAGKFPGLTAAGSEAGGYRCGSGGNLCVADTGSIVGCPAGDGLCGWSMRLKFNDYDTACDSNGRQPIALYPYIGNDSTPENHQQNFSNYSTCSNGLVKGTWYCIEGRVKMNTSGHEDGEYQTWVNGVSVQNLTGLLYSANSNSYNSIWRLWFDVYHGGALGVVFPPQDSSAFFDKIRIGTERQTCD